MQITVSGGIIRVDGIQYGTKYSSHTLAVNIAHQIKNQHYPHATVVDYPEPIQLPVIRHSNRKQKTCVTVSPTLQLSYA